MKLEKFVRTYDSVISKEQCDNLIQLFEVNSTYHENYNNELYKFNQLNLNTTPGCEQLANNFCKGLIPLFNNYFDILNFKKYVKINAFEHVRIKRYLKGTKEEFKTHVDVVDKDSAVRFCIAIAYLNKNNGSTVFPNLNLKIEPAPGRVVIFPPNWMFPHSGKAASDFDKYIMMTSLHYS